MPGRASCQLQRLATVPFSRQILRSVQEHHQYPVVRLNRALHTSHIRNFGRPLISRFFQRKPTSTITRWNSTKPSRATSAPVEPLSVSQRFRKLSREYGWTAMGVYFALSALDFPFCFAAVRWLGPERVGRAEETIVEGIKGYIPQAIKDAWREAKGKIQDFSKGQAGVQNKQGDSNDTPIAEIIDEYDHGVADAQILSRGANASIWTQLALAYAIHKSFIFIRLPITVAILPKVVKTLRGWGWQIGKRKPKIPN